MEWQGSPEGKVIKCDVPSNPERRRVDEVIEQGRGRV